MNKVDNIEVIANNISYIQRDIAEIKEKMRSDYVTREEFVPIQRFVYAIISIFGLSILGAIAKLIFIK